MNVLKFLQGKKTYILVATGLVVAGLHLVGLLDSETTNTALGFLGLGTVATLRSAIKNLLSNRDAESAPPSSTPPAA